MCKTCRIREITERRSKIKSVKVPVTEATEV